MMPLAVLMPTNATLGLVLPQTGRTEKNHMPFTNSVTIHGIKDRIEIMSSLQKPKKVNCSKALRLLTLQLELGLVSKIDSLARSYLLGQTARSTHSWSSRMMTCAKTAA